jgi:hypothetical protein
VSGRVGIRVLCATCSRTKKPIGRSAPHNGNYCDHECPGYRGAPEPDSLWPGEREEDAFPPPIEERHSG